MLKSLSLVSKSVNCEKIVFKMRLFKYYCPIIFTWCFRAFLASHRVQLTEISPLSLTVLADSLLGSVWKSKGKWKFVSRFPIEDARLLRNLVWKFGHSKISWCGESGVMQQSRHIGAWTVLSAFCTEYVKSWNLRQCPWRKSARLTLSRC